MTTTPSQRAFERSRLRGRPQVLTVYGFRAVIMCMHRARVYHYEISWGHDASSSGSRHSGFKRARTLEEATRKQMQMLRELVYTYGTSPT
jgi:hypothetical protein